MKKAMKYVEQCLRLASIYGLEVELVTYALKAMKDNPKISIQKAMEIGMKEWDI